VNRPSTVRVDPIACVGHGLCADLLPEVIDLDEWGYPRVARGPLDPALVPAARRAVAACPTLALHLASRPDSRAAGSASGHHRPTRTSG